MNVSYQASLVNRHIRRFTGLSQLNAGADDYLISDDPDLWFVLQPSTPCLWFTSRKMSLLRGLVVYTSERDFKLEVEVNSPCGSCIRDGLGA